MHKRSDTCCRPGQRAAAIHWPHSSAHKLNLVVKDRRSNFPAVKDKPRLLRINDLRSVDHSAGASRVGQSIDGDPPVKFLRQLFSPPLVPQRCGQRWPAEQRDECQRFARCCRTSRYESVPEIGIDKCSHNPRFAECRISRGILKITEFLQRESPIPLFLERVHWQPQDPRRDCLVALFASQECAGGPTDFPEMKMKRDASLQLFRSQQSANQGFGAAIHSANRGHDKRGSCERRRAAIAAFVNRAFRTCGLAPRDGGVF